MSFRPVPALIHATGLAIMFWGYSSLHLSPIDAYIRSQVGGHWQFLTIQGLTLAMLTLALALLGDLFPRSKTLSMAKRRLMMISMPLACTISSIYWSLLIFAPELIVPRMPHSASNDSSVTHGEPSIASDAPLARIPLTLDLALHATPGIVLALDFFLLERKYTRSEAYTYAPIASLLYGLFYGGLVEYMAPLNDGKFPYPFLTFNPLPIRIGIYAGAVSLALLGFNLLNSFHPGKPLTHEVGVVQQEVSSGRPT